MSTNVSACKESSLTELDNQVMTKIILGILVRGGIHPIIDDCNRNYWNVVLNWSDLCTYHTCRCFTNLHANIWFINKN